MLSIAHLRSVHVSPSAALRHGSDEASDTLSTRCHGLPSRQVRCAQGPRAGLDALRALPEPLPPRSLVRVPLACTLARIWPVRAGASLLYLCHNLIVQSRHTGFAVG